MKLKKRTKRKLKVWVKITIVAIISFIIYLKTGVLREFAQHSKIGQLVCALVWLWLFIGQFTVMYFIIEINEERRKK